METKQFNFVRENVLLWRGVARKKKICERETEKAASPFQICWCYWEKELGAFWWGKSKSSAEGFYIVSFVGGEREFLLIKWDSLVSSVWRSLFLQRMAPGFQRAPPWPPQIWPVVGRPYCLPERGLWTPTPVLLYRAMQNEEQELCLHTDPKQVPRHKNPFTLYGSAHTAWKKIKPSALGSIRSPWFMYRVCLSWDLPHPPLQEGIHFMVKLENVTHLPQFTRCT